MPTPPSSYTPPSTGVWETIAPEAAGFDPVKLAAVPAFHMEHESIWPRSMYMPDGEYAGTAFIEDKPPYNTPLGPVKPRGGPAGMLLRGGRLVTAWGDIDRADMTFSVAKSFLGVLTGLAVGRGLIRSLDDRMADYALDDGFETEHNRAITWRHMLEQTSEWEGTLFDRPDTVDRNRQVGPGTATGAKGEARPLRRPGSHWEYNDVRVNRLSLSLMQVFRQPLPAVLDEAIMAPIGATGWVWHGYRNSTVMIDGQPMESVSGGSHWGGGFQIPTPALARFGLLIARNGQWGGQQLIPADWIAQMLAPSPANTVYGFMWWLNTDRQLHPTAPASSFFAQGAGSNIIWIDPALDIVMVARWIRKESTDGLLAAVCEALAAP